jgi:hypothetical protein
MQAIRNAASHVPGSQSCWQRNWPRVFLLFSLATAVLCFVSIITGLITAVLHPRLVLLSIYCLIFALLGLSAEMRQFAWCRRVVYLWMRYFYFLTYYKARAVFYFMFGCLLFTDRALDIIAAVVAIVLGIMMLLVSLIVNLPVFEDPHEQQAKEEEFRNYYSGPAPNPAAAGTNAGTTAALAPAPAATTTTSSTGGVQADTPAHFNSGAMSNQSAAASQSPKVPPSAMPAQTNNDAYNQADTFRDSSDDEPVRHGDSSTYGKPSPNANPYETNPSDAYGDAGTHAFGSGGKIGPSMFAPSVSSRATSVAPPLQEAGMTRGTTAESAIRRDFAAAVAANVKDDDDLR